MKDHHGRQLEGELLNDLNNSCNVFVSKELVKKLHFYKWLNETIVRYNLNPTSSHNCGILSQ